MITFTTAGESHGKGLAVILEGVPAGLPVVADDIDHQLRRRMAGYGRGARMKIEDDGVEVLSGVRAGETIGSPIALLIRNRDWENWKDIMAAEPDPPGAPPRRRRLARPRPGHADLVGTLKYEREDARDVLERASARETAARVAAAGVCRILLQSFGVEIGSHVLSLGPIRAPDVKELPVPLNEVADQSPVRCLDRATSDAMVAAIDEAKRGGDTLGGIAEVVARGVVVGLGSHVAWHSRLDARLAQAVMSIPAVKGVEIGSGFAVAGMAGSEAHDEIAPGGDPRTGMVSRHTNRAGGLEGRMTTGEPLRVRGAMKPISTLMRPLEPVSLDTGKTTSAQSERSDVTAVPAMGVIAEAMIAMVLAQAMTEKFGGDSLGDMRRSYDAYVSRLEHRWDA